jgi:hypothetical protein
MVRRAASLGWSRMAAEGGRTIVSSIVAGTLLGAPLTVVAEFIVAGVVIAVPAHAPQAVALPIIVSPVLGAFVVGLVMVRRKCPWFARFWIAAAVGGASLTVLLDNVLEHVEI